MKEDVLKNVLGIEKIKPSLPVFLFVFWFGLVRLFETGSLCLALQTRMVSNLNREMLTSASQVLGLKTCAITYPAPSLLFYIIKNNRTWLVKWAVLISGHVGH